MQARRQTPSRNSRGGGPKRTPRNPQNDKPASQFAKPARMASAKSQIDGKRLVTTAAAEGEYLGLPPASQDWIEARLVIPGKHMLPRALDNPAALDGIRKTHKVWITNSEPNIFCIYSDTMPRLQGAIRDLNQAIYEMRVYGNHLTTRYMVQHPARTSEDVRIRVELGTRPCITAMDNKACDMSMALASHLQQLRSDLLSSAEILMTLGTNLRMRVNFGHLHIRQKKKGLGNEMKYVDFANMMKAYSVRGAARLDTWLPDINLVEAALRHLMDPALEICPDQERLRQSHSLILQVEDQELLVDAIILENNKPQLSPVRMTKPESWARLNWTMAAPDMKFDWNLRVDSQDVSDNIPTGLRDLVEGMSLSFARNKDHGDNQFRIPRLTVHKPGDWEAKVSEVRLKISIAIPLKDTPYVIEISITQIWKGLNTGTEPEIGWGLEVYGVHWDEAMNQVSPGERKKDWGEGLKNIWVGADPDLVNRFGEFLQIVLQIQAVLENVEPSAV